MIIGLLLAVVMALSLAFFLVRFALKPTIRRDAGTPVKIDRSAVPTFEITRKIKAPRLEYAGVYWPEMPAVSSTPISLKEAGVLDAEGTEFKRANGIAGGHLDRVVKIAPGKDVWISDGWNAPPPIPYDDSMDGLKAYEISFPSQAASPGKTLEAGLYLAINRLPVEDSQASMVELWELELLCFSKQSDGDFKLCSRSSMGLQYWHNVILCDINSDGTQDLVVVGSGGAGGSLAALPFSINNTGQLRRHTTEFDQGNSDAASFWDTSIVAERGVLSLADLNNDGCLEIVASQSLWYEMHIENHYLSVFGFDSQKNSWSSVSAEYPQLTQPPRDFFKSQLAAMHQTLAGGEAIVITEDTKSGLVEIPVFIHGDKLYDLFSSNLTSARDDADELSGLLTSAIP